MKIENKNNASFLVKPFQQEDKPAKNLDSSFAEFLSRTDLKSDIETKIETKLSLHDSTKGLGKKDQSQLNSIKEEKPQDGLIEEIKKPPLQPGTKPNKALVQEEAVPELLLQLKELDPEESTASTKGINDTRPEEALAESAREKNLSKDTQPQPNSKPNSMIAAAQDLSGVVANLLNSSFSDQNKNATSSTKSLDSINKVSGLELKEASFMVKSFQDLNLNANEKIKALDNTQKMATPEESQEKIISHVVNFFDKAFELKQESSPQAPIKLGFENLNQEEKLSFFREFQLSISSLNELNEGKNYNAKLHVYPDKLGAIEAEISIDKGEAHLILSAERPEVKILIQDNLQALRDSFEELNISLASIHLSQKGWQDSELKQSPHSLAQTLSKEPKSGENLATLKVNSSLIIDAYA